MSFKLNLLLVVLFPISNTFSQSNFETHTIDPSTEWPISLFVCDIDKDNDLDIISSEGNDNLISWYENIGYLEFQKHSISSITSFPRDIFAIDLDDDNDIDIIVASQNDNSIRWFENHGSQIFESHLISDSAMSVFRIFVIDLDQDSDIDVLSASIESGVAWHENNGSQVFETHLINSDIRPKSVFAIDMDLDDDIDVLSASDDNEDDSKIIWYENNGSEDFSAHIIEDSAKAAFTVTALDFDNDNDVDVFSGDLEVGIDWYENNGSESFTKHPISRTTSPEDVILLDFDNDNDIDVITCFFSTNKVSWFENNGFFNFIERIINPDLDTPEHVSVGDMDNDGDIDVIAGGSFNSRKIELYENLLITSIDESNPIMSPNNITLLGNYPNPFNPKTKIEFELSKPGKVEINVYNSQGRLTKYLLNEYKPAGKHYIEFDGAFYASGIYFYEMKTANFVDIKKMLLIK